MAAKSHLKRTLKLNFVLLLVQCIRPYLGDDTMINLYYTFFTLTLSMALSFMVMLLSAILIKF